MLFPSLLLLAVSSLVQSASLPIRNSGRNDGHAHSHAVEGALPARWYHEKDHPVHELFKRGGGDDGQARPAVGTPEWAAQFPPGIPDTTQLPAAWVSAYNAAVAAGKIPNIPASHSNPNASPSYPPGYDPTGPQVCSATYKCRNPEDIWDAPAGVFASAFDDGPYPTTPPLVDFLKANNVTTTHFMIGVNILNNANSFLYAFEADGDIAVHTWNHLYTTTLGNLDVLAQLGWTMQIIYESTGGRVPRYWRPPYGDSDERVRAIAKEVFGLVTVVWNQDSEDWTIGTNGVSVQSVEAALQGWITGPKTPGLIILEHEINVNFVTAFTTSFPLIIQNGWKFQSLATAFGESAYFNADSSNSADVELASVLVGADPAVLPSSSSATPTSTTSAPVTQSSTAGNPGASAADSVKKSGVPKRQSGFWAASIALCGLLTTLL